MYISVNSQGKKFMSRKLFSFEQEQEIINLYINEKKTSREIGRIFYCDKNAILDSLRRNNIERRRGSIAQQKYSVNESYFDDITTHEQAYILGLILADGSNKNNPAKPNYGTIYIGLQEEDKHILLQCSSLIQNTRPLILDDKSKQNIKWKKQYRLVIFSKHMSDVLANKWGCTSNKSYSLTFPDQLNPEFYNSFIRGFFDGDGCLYVPTHLRHTLFWFELVGTEMILNTIKNIFENHLNLYISPSGFKQARNAHTTIKRLRVTGRDNLITLLNWMYKDSNIHMDRKYIEYLKLLSIYDLNPRQRYRRNPIQLATANVV